jgi:hypothetical protein
MGASVLCQNGVYFSGSRTSGLEWREVKRVRSRAHVADATAAASNDQQEEME